MITHHPTRWYLPDSLEWRWIQSGQIQMWNVSSVVVCSPNVYPLPITVEQQNAGIALTKPYLRMYIVESPPQPGKVRSPTRGFDLLFWADQVIGAYFRCSANLMLSLTLTSTSRMS
jgi:hypothetical protein